jgi:predicted nucleic acid-binding protein
MIVFLDACALIYWQEVTEPFYSQLIATLTKIHQQNPTAKIAVSRLSQLECLVKPYKDNDLELISNYQAFFNADDLIIVELNAEIMQHAAILRATIKSLKPPDALQAACALSLPDEIIFVTNDDGFEKISQLPIQLLV